MGILAHVQSGSHAVIVDTCYGVIPTLTVYLARFGVSATYVNGRDTASILDAVRPETALIYLESPSSIVFDMQGVESYSVFTLYNPFRMVIDFKAGAPGNASPTRSAGSAPKSSPVDLPTVPIVAVPVVLPAAIVAVPVCTPFVE